MSREVLEALATQVYVKLRHSAVFARTVAGEQELARIISSSSDGILVIGEDLRIRSWSPAMERITGVPAGTAVGRPLGDVLAASDGEDDVWGLVGTSATERGETSYVGVSSFGGTWDAVNTAGKLVK